MEWRDGGNRRAGESFQQYRIPFTVRLNAFSRSAIDSSRTTSSGDKIRLFDPRSAVSGWNHLAGCGAALRIAPPQQVEASAIPGSHVGTGMALLGSSSLQRDKIMRNNMADMVFIYWPSVPENVMELFEHIRRKYCTD